MMKETRPGSGLYHAHYLLDCRLDNWFRLLNENGWHIEKRKIPQFLYMLGTSLLLTLPTLLEALIFALPIRRHKIEKAPVFIIGHWRSGTTYLQNIMSRDPQFGWCDPVSTTTFNNSYLLGWLTSRVQKKVLVDARPMDNMKYGLDLPMEDVFALNLISTHSIIHMIAFPRNYEKYLHEAFVEDQPARAQRQWARSTMYVLKKISLRKHGRRLLLKSPDHTCHPAALQKLFPDAKFVNIHRDPYVTIMSTINMFKKQMELIRLAELPDADMDDLLETVITGLFERMYKKLFAMQDSGAFGPGCMAEIAYTDLEKDPEGCLRRIYDQLQLDGYDAALPEFRKYIDAQKGYVKNKFTIGPRLRSKINSHLGFYFERYGYAMTEE